MKTRVRRTNTERTSQMRARIIGAAIEALHSVGYSASTTSEVERRAHISHGALLHHFPTRTRLLLAVAQFIVEDDRNYRRARVWAADVLPALQRFSVAAEVSWAVHQRPSTIALLEIMMATRSDPALGKVFAPFLKSWHESNRSAAQRMAADLGVTDIAKVATLIRLHQAARRGLAIELMFTHDNDEVDKARLLLTDFERHYAEQLIAAAKPARPRKPAARKKSR